MNWGLQANIGMGPFIFAHIYLEINLEVPFCRDGYYCCTMVVSNVSTFFIYMGFFHLYLLI